jgi:hypothetical protein
MADARDSKSREPSAQVPGIATPYDLSPDCLGRTLGAFAAEIAPFAPDLSAIMDAWPTLPEPIKIGILAMVKASTKS